MAEFTPEKSKQIALARLDLVHKWLEFRHKFTNKLQADYDFVKLLMQNIMKTIDNKEPTNQAMLYSLMNLLKQMPELQNFENKVKEQPKKQIDGISPDVIREVNKILGIE